MELGRRGFVAGSLGAAGVAVLAGCTTGQNRTTVADWPTEPGDEKATITWWSSSIPDDSGGDLRNTLIKAFHKRYPNIKVNLVAGPSDTDVNRTTLTTQIAAGSPTPDVSLGDIAWPGQFARNKLAVPANDLVPSDYWDQFSEGLRDAAQVDGEYYMFPVYIDEGFLCYRKDLLDKHGLQVPNSWEEVAATSKKLIQAGDVKSGFVYQGNVYEGLTCSVTEFTADAGGTLVNDDYTKSTVTSSETRSALEFMQSLVKDGVTPRASMTYIEQASLDAFTTGRAAFLRNWSYAYDVANSPSSSNVAGKVGVRPRPGFDGGPQGHSTIGGWGNYINPHTEHPAAALAFAKWMSGEEAQMLIVDKGGVIPASMDALNSEAAAKKKRPQYEAAKDITLVARPTATGFYPKLSQAIFVNANAIILGQKGLESGTKQMASQMNIALEGRAL
ncbi:MAG: ABC transporter substrate-binding protein [Galactobacter sp.]|uniref:ABC transporter substrate-binding protein n=1 Tax=Galactobacter sp. TaxID=2676125 RepID=UPI0025BA6586|nr:ABC transporter substrate-binding protein [Galactobacter sp.]